MSNELALNNNTQLSMWEDKQQLMEIKKLFAPKLSDMEFQYFVGLGKATNLNPFLREIWSVKYQDSAPAQVFIGRDGYRKAAQAHSEYDYHQCDAVYENDSFDVHNGEVKHSYKLTNRGALVGAYCIAKRHKSSRPIYVFAELKEYSTGKSLWNPQTGKPATMIKKVAESQCLRACFQDLLGGTYGEEELEREPVRIKVIQEEASSDLKDLINKNNKRKGEIYDSAQNKDNDAAHSAIFDSRKTNSNFKHNAMGQDGIKETSIVDTDYQTSKITEEQIITIENLAHEKSFPDERMRKALNHYGVSIINELNFDHAVEFIAILHKEE